MQSIKQAAQPKRRRKKRGLDSGSTAAIGRIETWWACGYRHATGRRFVIRRIVSGRLLARAERREGETIRKVLVTVMNEYG